MRGRKPRRCSRCRPRRCAASREFPVGGPFLAQLRLCVGQPFHCGGDEGLAGLAAVLAHHGKLEQCARLLGTGQALGYPYLGSRPAVVLALEPIEDELVADRDRRPVGRGSACNRGSPHPSDHLPGV